MDLYGVQNSHYTNPEYKEFWGESDPTTLHKTALMTAHANLFPGARVADMGCLTGEGTYHLAVMNPHVSVVGVDIFEDNVLAARKKYGKVPNLSFVVGDAEHPGEQLKDFDAYLNSSVMHHIFSYNRYDAQRVSNTITNQYNNLRHGGIDVIRDFVAMPDDKYGYLDLSSEGHGTSPLTMSDADLFLLFSKTARPLTPERGVGFFTEEVSSPYVGGRRFYVSEKWKAEFLPRKDYREVWESEANEIYGAGSAADYRRWLEATGGRVLYSAPYWNRWNMENRLRGKVQACDLNGKPVAISPTNFIVIVQRIDPEESARLYEKRPDDRAISYLSIKSYANSLTEQIHDVAERPGKVSDFIPYAEVVGDVFVLAKCGFARPVANVCPRGPNLTDQRYSGHMVEPIAAGNLGDHVDQLDELAKRSGLKRENFVGIAEGLTYFPAVGLSSEQATSQLVELNPQLLGETRTFSAPYPRCPSGYSAQGDVRLYSGQALLRAAQVGTLPEGRLELGVYTLLRQRGIAPDAWLDGKMEPPEAQSVHAENIAVLFDRTKRSVFTPVETRGSYIQVRRSLFAEQAGDGSELAVHAHEFVMLNGKSANTAVVLPIARDKDGDLCLGLRRQNLPAPQEKNGDSGFFMAREFYLPNSVETLEEAGLYAAERLGVPERAVKRLGEGFFASIGVFPQRLFPFVAIVEKQQDLEEGFFFVKTKDFYAQAERFQDLPLLISGFRAIHALGEWPRRGTCALPQPGPQP